MTENEKTIAVLREIIRQHEADLRLCQEGLTAARAEIATLSGRRVGDVVITGPTDDDGEEGSGD